MKENKSAIVVVTLVLILIISLCLTSCENIAGQANKTMIIECNDGIDNDENGYIDYEGGCDFNNNGILDKLPYSSMDTGITYYEREMTEEECVVEETQNKGNFGNKLSGSAILGWIVKKNSQEVYKIDFPQWYASDPGCSSKHDLNENHCGDGIYNGGEEGLDCGWTCPEECFFVEKSGDITQDETWSGNIYVSGYVNIEEGITLTIEPGTIVKFKYDRNYKTFQRGGLTIDGGNIRAVGTSQELIWFTSSAPDPINGDWDKISVDNSDNSEFDYIIIEFAEMGISQDSSDATISNSIIRWTNSEGLYAERSEPRFEGNLLYGNGYHEIALEQYNDATTLNNIFRDGHRALHNENTNNYISGNCFSNEFDGITAGMGSSIEVYGNYFSSIENDDINVYDRSNINGDYENENYFDENYFECPELNLNDIINFNLAYIPGDENDLFPYIYDTEDETRRVLDNIGEGLGFGWALEFVDDKLYRFSIGSGSVGDSLDFIKIDPITGTYELFGNDEIMNPRGLTYDGEFFYVNDFSLLRIFKFTLDEGEDYITIHDSFDIPDIDLGGTNGLTTDGDYLYLRSRDGNFLYKISKEGVVFDQINVPGGPVVWTGEHFLTTSSCSKDICKYTSDGDLVGEIYPPAKEVWGLAWDGEYLWTLQRTCEMWDDPKIYQIEILDDTPGVYEPVGCVEEEDYLLIGDNRECCEDLIAYDCNALCPGDYCCDPGEFVCLTN